MRKKQLIGLCVVLVAVVAALFGVIFANKAKEAKEEAEAEAAIVYVNAFSEEEVCAFSYEISGEVVSFTLSGEDWSCDADETLVLDEEAIASLLSEMGQITANSELGEVNDVSEYGINEPSQTFTATFSDGSTATYLFGSTNGIVGGIYLQVVTEDASLVYLVDETATSSTLSVGLEDLQVEEDDELSE